MSQKTHENRHLLDSRGGRGQRRRKQNKEKTHGEGESLGALEINNELGFPLLRKCRARKKLRIIV